MESEILFGLMSEVKSTRSDDGSSRKQRFRERIDELQIISLLFLFSRQHTEAVKNPQIESSDQFSSVERFYDRLEWSIAV